VLKTFDMYFNLTNEDIVFSLLDSANSFIFLIGAVNKMTLSGSGLSVNGNTTISGAVNCGSLTTTGAINCGSLTTSGAINCGSLTTPNAVSCGTNYCSGYVGIGELSLAYKCHIKTTLNDLDKSFHSDAGENVILINMLQLYGLFLMAIK
jgi:hypothetical protein